MAGRLFLVAARARHEHDCDACQLVGLMQGADLYYCPSSHTYVARRSDDGPDYISTSLDIVKRVGEAGVNPLIWSAHQRHKALGDLMFTS